MKKINSLLYESLAAKRIVFPKRLVKSTKKIINTIMSSKIVSFIIKIYSKINEKLSYYYKKNGMKKTVIWLFTLPFKKIMNLVKRKDMKDEN